MLVIKQYFAILRPTREGLAKLSLSMALVLLKLSNLFDLFHTFYLQVRMCVVVHQSVATKSIQFLAELSRHNYVTPTSYLELLGIYGKLLGLKKNELKTARNRTKTGLDKVRS